jgi:uncharacterized protein (TIGR02266 family)
MIQTRKDIRVPVSLKSRYRMPTMFDFVEAPCYDLSRGGMFIESDRPAERGTLLKIECDALDQEGPILGVGRVVWRRARNEERGPMGMGIKFVRLDPASDKVIADLVEKSGGREPSAGGKPVADNGEDARSFRERLVAGKVESSEGAAGEASVAGGAKGEAEGLPAAADSHRVSPVAAVSPRARLTAEVALIGLVVLAFLTAALAIMLP